MTSAIQRWPATPAATRALGAAVAAWLRPGDVVALSGELGAGKTCFVQGAAAGLGVAGRVTSPTFVLSRQYRGRVDVVHVDVYRLERLSHLDQLGDDVLAPDVVTFVEWADAVAGVLPDDRLDVRLSVADPPTEAHGSDAAEGSPGRSNDAMPPAPSGAGPAVQEAAARATGERADGLDDRPRLVELVPRGTLVAREPGLAVALADLPAAVPPAWGA